jgi:perosamine synthetase
MRVRREEIAATYLDALSDIAEVELPPRPSNRIHAWHLFSIRLRLETLAVDRSSFMSALKEAGVGCSVHWRPLHLHPYYQETFGWRPEHCPVATREWERLISLPIFSAMTDAEVDHVIATVRKTYQRTARIPA